MITLEAAKNLKRGDILVDAHDRKWKVNGKVQTWKTRPNEIKVPLKFGLYHHDYLTHETLNLLTLR